MKKVLVMKSATLSIHFLNYMFREARRLKMGIPQSVYGEPSKPTLSPWGEVFTEWGLVCEKGIVCSRPDGPTEGMDAQFSELVPE
jgi:hypothetical protein